MLIAASMPAMADDPMSPDLIIDEASVNITPQPLVDGVPAVVTFEVSNVGAQNSYDLMASLFDHGVEVVNKTLPALNIGNSWSPVMIWTPTMPGDYDLTMKAWYGPSDKEDVKWADNTIVYSVSVRSRPDASIGTTDLSYEADNPEYVVDGDLVTIKAIVHNQGTADITSCNVSLWEAEANDDDGVLIERHTGVAINGSVSVEQVFAWDTTGWSGKRRLIVDVEGVKPNETDLGDNTAWFELKVHTKEDLVFTTRNNEIDSPFKIQFFITVEDSGELSIIEGGNATVFQDFPDQYDMLVTDQGQITIDRGLLWSDLNFTILLYDNAQLTLTGANSNVRVVAVGNCGVTIWNSTLDSPSIEMIGGTLDIRGSTVIADRMQLSNVDVHIENSDVRIGETVYFDGGLTSIRDTTFSVVREFEGLIDALDAYPVLKDFDPDTNEVTGLTPAIVARGGSIVDLYNVTVESKVLITSDNNLFWTPNRLGADGRTSFVNIYRYLVVEVRDWSDQVVPDAMVEVLDYFQEMVIANGTTGPRGDVTLEVITDYITEAQKPFVGNLRVRATAFGRTSEDLRFSHFKYPDMGIESNIMTVRIEMPPNPHPDPGPHVITYRTPHEIVGGESGMDMNIIVDNTELTLRDTRFTLEQDHDFKWFILVTGEFGTLTIINSTVRSDFLFTIFLEEGATLNMTMGSSMPGVRIIASDQSVIQIVDTSLEGGIYAECGAIEFVRAHLDLEHTHLEASTISITGGYVHERADMVIKANDVHIVDVELSADYDIADDVGFTTLRDLVRYFGWSLLNDLDFLTNISLGYFNDFAVESNITIETSHLTIDNALIFATETNILVRRSPLPDQARILDSWVGGIDLELVSDDLRAEYTSFNRVLDDFDGADHAKLYSVEVPGIVCSGSAQVERFWYVTVEVYDGAGSVVYGALLEVFSTDTNVQLLPVTGTESLSTSRTNTAGRLTVPVLTNETDSTGDYYKGSVYLWCMFDGLQFTSNPIYTNTVQANIKTDRTFVLDFKETITPPQKEIMYSIYNMSYSGPSEDLRFYHFSYDTQEEAEAFMAMVHGFEPDRVRANWTMVRNSTVDMTFEASSKINDVWTPLSEGLVKVYVLDGHNVRFDPSKIARFDNGTEMVYDVYPDENGWGNVSIEVPSSLANFQLYIAISGGQFDPLPQPIEGREWNFTVAPPQTVRVDDQTELSQNPVIVGSLVTVSGYVRYIYTNGGVEGAEVTISGTHISTTNGRTDSDGRFAINIQAPILVIDNLTMFVRAEDPRTGENNTYGLPYDVVQVPKNEPDKEVNWAFWWTLIILGVLGFTIAFGAVMMYRKHYGEVVECGECGAFIAASSTACPKCGIEFETDLARCSECEAWIPANSSACPVCGTAFTIQSLEEQVAREEADEEIIPIDQVTTSTSTMTPLALEAASEAKWGEREEKRRRRIKKRVKKRLTVTDTTEMQEDEDAAKDLFIGDDTDSTRLPGLDIDDSGLGDEDLSQLLPTENMLKDLMLTTDVGPVSDETEALEPEGDLDLEEDEPSEVDEAADEVSEGDEGEPSIELEEVSLEDAVSDGDGSLEEIPPPVEPEGDIEAPHEEEDLGEDGGVPPEPEAEEAEGPESRELLSELGLMAKPKRRDLDADEGPEDDTTLSGLLTEEEDSKEAPKLCPNCGGNWILYKDGEYTCRICGENW